MKARLLKDSSKDGKAGEIIEVSPDRMAFLLSIEAAEPVKAEKKRKTSKEKGKTK